MSDKVQDLVLERLMNSLLSTKSEHNIERAKQRLRDHYIYMSFPPDSCPYIDKIQLTLDALKSDIELLGGDDPAHILSVLDNTLKVDLELVRGINETLRSIGQAWRRRYFRAIGERP